jgi:nucleotide-binding universal stress UspA family protein
MLPYKTIVCPTDFSRPSFEALKEGNDLALHFSSTLYVVHVVPPLPPITPPMAQVPHTLPEMSVNAERYRQELVESSEKALEEVLERKTDRERIGMYPLVLEGHVAEEIVRVAQDKDADLIVMGTHGETGWRRMVFGSVAEKVIRSSPLPVLTVPPREQEE